MGSLKICEESVDMYIGTLISVPGLDFSLSSIDTTTVLVKQNYTFIIFFMYKWIRLINYFEIYQIINGNYCKVIRYMVKGIWYTMTKEEKISSK